MTHPSPSTRAGFVTLVGKPNAGKSTLLNRLVGERLAIVSSKPQSTRERVVGILTDQQAQLIFLDTPGLLEPRYALHQAMRHAAQQAIADADVVVHLIDAADHLGGVPVPGDTPVAAFDSLETLAGLPRPPKAPVLLVLNHCDRLSPEQHREIDLAHPEALRISAATGEGVPALLARLREAVPASPFLYDADDVSTQHLRFFVAEFLRECAFEQLEQEVPYGIAVEIEEFREGSEPVYIRATLHVERESQKGIVIGSGGGRIKAMGSAARTRIEALLGAPVFLDLRVKVLANWRRDPAALARLGFPVPDEGRR